MKILKRVTIAVAVLSVLYLAGAVMLLDTDLSYRMVPDLLGKGCVLLLLPLLLLIMVIAAVCRLQNLHRVIKGVLTGVLLVGYLFWAFGVCVFLLFTTDEEHRLTDGVLLVNEAEFLSENKWVYYRPVALVLRREDTLTVEDMQHYLEKKYKRSFSIEDYAARGEYCVFFREENSPEVKVSVYRDGWEFQDDYVEGLAIKYLAEGCEELNISREYTIEKGYNGRNGIFYLELAGEEDIDAFAAEVSQLIQYVMSADSIWEDYRGYLYFANEGFVDGDFGEEGGGQENTGMIPFGKLSRWDNMEEDYYLHPEQIAELVSEKYRLNEEQAKERQEREQQYEEQAKEQYEQNMSQTDVSGESEYNGTGAVTGGTGQNASGESSDTEQTEALTALEDDTVVAGARLVYEAVLEQEGYSCEVRYNAKGVPYLDLGSRPAQEGDNSADGTYRFTLLYDRTSKNGACELYVLYKEHYTEEGSNDSTGILNFYAVETATGEVIAADKTSWSEVGSAEYREATGE